MKVIHKDKNYNYNKSEVKDVVKTVSKINNKLSPKKWIRKTAPTVFERHFHISTPPINTSSFLNIYLIDSFYNLVGITK